MKRYETPQIDMLYYELDHVIMDGEEESQVGEDITANPWGGLITPTTSAGSVGGGIALKY